MCSEPWMIRFVYVRELDCCVLCKNYISILPSNIKIWKLVKEIQDRDGIMSLLDIKAPGKGLFRA